MSKITLQGEANLPTAYGTFRMRAYSCKEDDYVPTIVLLNPNTRMDESVYVRIHSECITGDLFGSIKCECGEQLDKSLETIGEKGGVLIYLRQEGRGIGIINKLHAYREQEKGLDTVEANRVLGFDIDQRRYDVAINLLKDLGIKNIKLLTNNPDKYNALKNANFESVERISLEIKPKAENEKYLRTKKEMLGHHLILNRD
jgi:3,4-dihydroxy 2-butanone 4-phosphate synthase/GTP cyclohydrolase II